MQASTMAWREAEHHLTKVIEVKMRAILYTKLDEYRSTRRKLTFADWVTRTCQRSAIFWFDDFWSLNLTNIHPEAYMDILGRARSYVIRSDFLMQDSGKPAVGAFAGLTIGADPVPAIYLEQLRRR